MAVLCLPRVPNTFLLLTFTLETSKRAEKTPFLWVEFRRKEGSAQRRHWAELGRHCLYKHLQGTCHYRTFTWLRTNTAGQFRGVCLFKEWWHKGSLNSVWLSLSHSIYSKYKVNVCSLPKNWKNAKNIRKKSPTTPSPRDNYYCHFDVSLCFFSLQYF